MNELLIFISGIVFLYFIQVLMQIVDLGIQYLSTKLQLYQNKVQVQINELYKNEQIQEKAPAIGFQYETSAEYYEEDE